MQARPGTGRQSSYHSPKRQLVGNTAGRAAPAWKAANNPQSATHPAQGQAPGGARATVQGDSGSKIIMSNLPNDVREEEIADLMKRTVGPAKETFIIYNSQSMPKGMAVVVFSRSGDAMKAREKYNGKVIDGRRALKIEIIMDSDILSPPSRVIPQAPRSKSLLDRMSAPAQQKQPSTAPHLQIHVQPVPNAPRRPRASAPEAKVQPPMRRVRTKKGARRVKKSVEQLDREMEEYRAVAVTEEYILGTGQ